MKALETAREAIRHLPSDASFEQLRQAAIRAGREVTLEYAAEEARARAQAQTERESLQAERQKQERKSMKQLLVSVGVGCVSGYLRKLHSDGQIWSEDLERNGGLENLVRSALEDKLRGNESFEEAQRIAFEVVDRELE